MMGVPIQQGQWVHNRGEHWGQALDANALFNDDPQVSCSFWGPISRIFRRLIWGEPSPRHQGFYRFSASEEAQVYDLSSKSKSGSHTTTYKTHRVAEREKTLYPPPPTRPVDPAWVLAFKTAAKQFDSTDSEIGECLDIALDAFLTCKDEKRAKKVGDGLYSLLNTDNLRQRGPLIIKRIEANWKKLLDENRPIKLRRILIWISQTPENLETRNDYIIERLAELLLSISQQPQITGMGGGLDLDASYSQKKTSEEALILSVMLTMACRIMSTDLAAKCIKHATSRIRAVQLVEGESLPISEQGLTKIGLQSLGICLFRLPRANKDYQELRKEVATWIFTDCEAWKELAVHSYQIVIALKIIKQLRTWNLLSGTQLTTFEDLEVTFKPDLESSLISFGSTCMEEVHPTSSSSGSSLPDSFSQESSGFDQYVYGVKNPYWGSGLRQRKVW